MAITAAEAAMAIQSSDNGRPRVKGAPWHSGETKNSDKDPITWFLGAFSIGLGVAELLAPRHVARLIGVHERRHTRLLRIYGLRGIAAGIGILARPKPTYWMWNRVIGDTIDLASMSRALDSRGTDESRLRLAMAAVAGVTLLDIAMSVRLTSESSPAAGHDSGSFHQAGSENGHRVMTAAITVNRPVEEVYGFWKDPRNYASLMDHIESVNPTTRDGARWKVKMPAGMSVEWDSRIVEDVPNKLIRWRASGDSSVENVGAVKFRKAPGNRGTVVTLDVEYKPRAGAIGGGVARLFKVIPKTQLMNDLRRVKQLIEIGEVLRSDATAVPDVTHAAQPREHHELEAVS